MKLRILYVLLVLILCMLFLIVSCLSNPVSVVKSYRDYYNKGRIDSLMALIADDATFSVSGAFDLTGKQEIRDVAAFDTTLHLHMTMVGFGVLGDTVSCTLIEKNDWITTAGLDSAVYSARFVIKDGKLTSLIGDPTEETSGAFLRVVPPLLAWATEQNHPELPFLVVNGGLQYNARSAASFLTILRDWQAAKQDDV